MTVVSDTSPISYLVLIGREGVTAELYGEVLVPRQSARSWFTQRARRWFESEFPLLGGRANRSGERVAILLVARKESGLLIDERAGRITVARKLGVTVTAAIGVLGAAVKKGLIDQICAA